MHQLITVRIADLKPAKHNPPRRTDPTNPKVKKMVKSVGEQGVIYPILITHKRHVVDGHIRITACKIIGIKNIPAFVTEKDPDDTYGHVNYAKTPFTNNDYLHIYLSRPDALPPTKRVTFARIEEEIGRETLKELKEWGGADGTYKMAKAVDRYLGSDGNMLPSILQWMMRNNQTMPARRAMEGAIAPSQLRKAILENRQLANEWKAR